MFSKGILWKPIITLVFKSCTGNDFQVCSKSPLSEELTFKKWHVLPMFSMLGNEGKEDLGLSKCTQN